jgi:hypothetical protein
VRMGDLAGLALLDESLCSHRRIIVIDARAL